MVSKGNSNQEAKERFSDKFDSYSHLDKAKEWLRKNSHLVRKMFENVKLRDFIFEPFKDVFHSKEKTDNSKILCKFMIYLFSLALLIINQDI